MLPLFGTIRKYPITHEIIVDLAVDWCVPTDQELYGKRSENECKSESESESESSVVTVKDETETVLLETATSTVTVTATSTVTDSFSIEELENNNCTESFESLNETEPEIIFSRISTDNETFSLMNTETTIVNVSDMEYTNDFEFEFENEDEDIKVDVDVEDDDAVVVDFIAVLKRLEVLERKYDDMNSIITKLEESSKFGMNSDANPSAFVTHFIGIMQETMKSGISYQRDVLGKLCDEIDDMFNIDFTNFDPFK